MASLSIPLPSNKRFSDLIVKALPCGKHWEVVVPCTYHVGSPNSGDTVEIPIGFITDFGSIPFGLRWAVSPQGRAQRAYVLHDVLYDQGLRSRLVCDAILIEAMDVCGCNWLQKKMVWRGLQLGGWWAWNEHRRRDEKKLSDSSCTHT